MNSEKFLATSDSIVVKDNPHMAAMKQGQQSAQQGEPLEMNPYKEHKDARAVMWLVGWKRGSMQTMSVEDWNFTRGPRGGNIWSNVRTGEVRRQKENPGGKRRNSKQKERDKRRKKKQKMPAPSKLYKVKTFGDVDSDVLQTYLDGLDAIPPEIRHRIEGKFKTKVWVGSGGVLNMKPQWRGEVPRGQKGRRSYDAVSAIYDPNLGANEIVLSSKIFYGGQWRPQSTKQMLHGVHHEYGHAIDYSRGRLTELWSETEEFRDAWEKDVADLLEDTGSVVGSGGTGEEHSLTGDAADLSYYIQIQHGQPSAAIGASEAFAESVAFILGEPSNREFPGRFKRSVGFAVEVLDKIMKGEA